jgi:hypothetical protein
MFNSIIFINDGWNHCTAVLAICSVFAVHPEQAFAESLGVRFETPAGSSRDGSFNRIVHRGAAKTGSATSSQANSISVITTGSGNTIILNVEQINFGAVVSASSLNGTLNLE